MYRHLPALLACALLILFSASRPNEPQLTLLIEGLENKRGNVMLRIKDATDSTVKNIKHPISVLPPQIKINLPAGRYAVAAFHDENGNEKLDRAWNGMPQEPYGFSNGVRGSILGPPDLADQLFSLSSSRKLKIQIE
ncbi:MAG: DUF2141 domain-containing protein [Schleiferiaceae bacterium]|nr:DUF2141 domain-containing protein [Schleiferiaceae bacterium]MDR9441193.1 DUF2141 domain-containing protein [Schleiferiaceae bacterium]